MIQTTKPRGRPKRRHSEGIGNHSSKRPRTASVEVTLPADTTSYSLPSTSSSIMSEVVNVILAQVASQQRQQQQQSQVLSDEVQENVEVMSAPPHSNELIIIENSLDSTNTVEVWAGGEGGGANMTGEVNQILQRIGVEQSGETIQDPEGDVIVTGSAAEVVSQEIITVETPCDDEAVTTVTACDEIVTTDAPIVSDSCHDEGVTVSEPTTNHDTIATVDVSEQVLATKENNDVENSTTAHDNITTPDDVTLHRNDIIITTSNDNNTANDNV